MMVQSALTGEEEGEGKEYSKINVWLLQLLRLDSIALGDHGPLKDDTATTQNMKYGKMTKSSSSLPSARLR